MPVLCTVSLGSASHTLNARWFEPLLTVPVILALFDANKAGGAGIDRVGMLTRRIRPLRLPAGLKDLNEFRVVCRDAKRSDSVFFWLKETISANTCR